MYQPQSQRKHSQNIRSAQAIIQRAPLQRTAMCMCMWLELDWRIPYVNRKYITIIGSKHVVHASHFNWMPRIVITRCNVHARDAAIQMYSACLHMNSEGKRGPNQKEKTKKQISSRISLYAVLRVVSFSSSTHWCEVWTAYSSNRRAISPS